MMRAACLLLLLLFPTTVLAEEGDDDPSEETAPAPLDPLSAKMHAMVADYYEAIGSEATTDELRQGTQSVQMMLLDGVSISRIEAAIADAVALHSPGRRIPFQVAVPLRVRPAEAAPGPGPAPSRATTDPGPPRSGEPEREPAAVDERWVERQEELKRRRNRLRLYSQWRDRTRDRRILLGVGIPLLAGGWAGTFAITGGAANFGEVSPAVGWTGAVPIAGPFIFGALTEGAYPAAFVFGVFQGFGLGLTIAGLAQSIDWPHDRDPTALRLGRDPRTDRPTLTLHPGPMGVVGVF